MPVARASLIVLGYNSARFVEEAIESAFHQNYGDLEIILSDDCSLDGTFERMMESAARYKGPHIVKLNRTEVNVGTLAHLYHAVSASTGHLIVLSAADDISYPHRVQTLIAAWRSSGAKALFSSLDRIDESGHIIAPTDGFKDHHLEWLDYFPDVLAIRGATSAYDRSVFNDIPPTSTRILFEDTFFTLMLHLNNSNIAYVDEPLVGYRVHADAITNADFGSLGRRGIIERERKAQTYAASILAVLETFEARLGQDAAPTSLASDRQFYEFRSRWMNTSFDQRLHALVATRRSSHRRWVIVRLLGAEIFAYAKLLASALRKSRR